MSILKEIRKYKLEFIENQKSNISQSEIIDKCKNINSDNANLFSKKLINERNQKISIIGELKKSSPSTGNIVNKSINLIELAKQYEKNGISCISVLTDEKYFNGSNEDLIKVKKNTNLPVLRKDFIVDQYQIFESKIIGADCILLILSILDEIESSLFEQIALDIGLDVLIEVHNEKEMKRAEKMKSPLVGINNRNLSDFSVDINNSINVSRSMNSNKIPIAESGFHSRIDIDYVLKNSKIDTFLIGESLMRSSNLSQNIKNFIN